MREQKALNSLGHAIVVAVGHDIPRCGLHVRNRVAHCERQAGVAQERAVVFRVADGDRRADGNVQAAAQRLQPAPLIGADGVDLHTRTLARDDPGAHILHTREVRPITLDGQRVEEDTISSVSLFFFAYMIILFFSALIVSLDELDFTSAFTASLTCISNVGPGLGLVGPTCNFGFLSPLSKLVLSFTMLLGRLEIMPLLVLFLPSVWRKK